MNPTGKKLISLFLVFSLMMLSVNLYAKERRGAKLIITKLDGQLIEGELITVKTNSLLLLDTYGKDVSINIGNIKVIRVMKKSKFWMGTGIGLAPALLAGVIMGLGPEMYEDFVFWEGLVFGLILGIPFALVGGAIGALAGIDETIKIEGMTDLEIQETLNKLQKKARIRDYK